MADSGARGSKRLDAARSLAGMRGLMAEPSGEIVQDAPITRELPGRGWNVLPVLHLDALAPARLSPDLRRCRPRTPGDLTRRLVGIVSRRDHLRGRPAGPSRGSRSRGSRQGGEDHRRAEDFAIVGRVASGGRQRPADRQGDAVRSAGTIWWTKTSPPPLPRRRHRASDPLGADVQSKRGVCIPLLRPEPGHGPPLDVELGGPLGSHRRAIRSA